MSQHQPSAETATPSSCGIVDDITGAQCTLRYEHLGHHYDGSIDGCYLTWADELMVRIPPLAAAMYGDLTSQIRDGIYPYYYGLDEEELVGDT